MKRVNIKCPYCGSQAYLRPATVVYGKKASAPNAQLYVCGRFPACDSYVAAHRDSHLPMGTLANADLRRQRVMAHAAFNRLWESGLMTRKQAYRWLQAKLGLPEQETHIGKFATYRCEQVIQLCNSLFPDAPQAVQPQRPTTERRREDEMELYPNS